jgi:hypothetical protein
MIQIDVRVQNRRAVNRLDSRDELLDDFRPAAFTEIRHTLDDAFQPLPPIKLLHAHLKISSFLCAFAPLREFIFWQALTSRKGAKAQRECWSEH